MIRTYTYRIWPEGLDFSEKLSLLSKFAEIRLMSPQGEREFNLVTFNRYERGSTRSADEFLEAIKKQPQFESFEFEKYFGTEDRKKEIIFRFKYRGHEIDVAIDSSDDDVGIAAHKFIRDEFGLSNPAVPNVDKARAKYLMPTIFLGRHFDERGENASRPLREFLGYLGFRVVEGDKFQAGAIPDKVKNLIDDQAIYICLLTGKREHDWLVAESAYAVGKGRHVILIVEEDSNFNPSIHGGDFERIPFKTGAIEQSFLKLLQEFRAVGIRGS